MGGCRSASALADCKSWSAFVSQLWTSSRFSSSIEPCALFGNLVFEGGTDMAIPLEFGTGAYMHLHGHRQAPQRPICMRRSLMWRDLALWYDNDHINIAVVGR